MAVFQDERGMDELSRWLAPILRDPEKARTELQDCMDRWVLQLEALASMRVSWEFFQVVLDS